MLEYATWKRKIRLTKQRSNISRLLGNFKRIPGVGTPERRIEITRDIKFLKMPEIETQNNENFDPEDFYKDNTRSNSNEIMIESTPLENHSDLGPLNRVSQEDIAEESIDQTIQNDATEETLDQATREDNAEEESLPSTPRRAPGRPRIECTGQRGRPRKLFNLKYAEDIEIMNPEYAFVAETSIRTALSSANANEWLDAMASEIKSIIKNDT